MGTEPTKGRIYGRASPFTFPVFFENQRAPRLNHRSAHLSQKRTSALWNHRPCFLLVINLLQILDFAECEGTAPRLCFWAGDLCTCPTSVFPSIRSLLPLCKLGVLTLGNVLLLRCGQSPADSQPAQCHDLPKKQLRAQRGGDLRRPLPLCAVSAL